MTQTASIHTLKNGHTLAYHRFTPEQTQNRTGVVFLGGFKSDMNGSKAQYLDQWCKKRHIPFLRFDYLGHGESSGAFTDFTIGDWAENVVTAIDHLTSGPQIIVGSSMGGWLMLLATLKRPERISALLGIAAAPDFTEDLMWAKLSADEQHTLQTEGVYTLPTECHHANQEDYEPYTITHTLITEARKQLLLSAPININCPVRLIHGLNDQDVPHAYSLILSDKLTSTDVAVTVQKNADHRMSEPENLALLGNTLENLLS